MYVTSITHREELFDLATRWWADKPLPGDALFLTRVFAYEGLVTVPAVNALIHLVRKSIQPHPMGVVRTRSKDELREIIARSCRNPTPREAELFSAYRECPEEFFPGTPSGATVGFREDGEILGMVRFKRIRRVADKTSRRIADSLAGIITDTARQLARDRALRMGRTLDSLQSSPAEMAQDFHQAERIVARSFKHGLMTFDSGSLRIDDGIGLKLVGTPKELAAMEGAIRACPQVIEVQKEEHRGAYNDINLLVDLQLPPSGTLVDAARAWDWSRQAGCGLSEAELAGGFPEWVESGERTFRVEVILTTREDLVESEFGASIHEARILDQRGKSAYAGRIAVNASYITRYMAMVALSPTVAVDGIPVKMWGRYLPDAYATAVWDLFGISHEREPAAVVPWDGADPEGFKLLPMEGGSATHWQDRQSLLLMDLA